MAKQSLDDIANDLTRAPLFCAAYTSAWHEVTTRIALRQNTIHIYVTLVMGVFAAIAAIKTAEIKAIDRAVPAQNVDANKPKAQEQEQEKLEQIYATVIYAIPILSVIFVFMNNRHQRSIAYLRGYLGGCESAANANTYGYNTQWRQDAVHLRGLHNKICVALISLSNFVAIFIHDLMSPTDSQMYVLVFCTVVIVGSAWYMMSSGKQCENVIEDGIKKVKHSIEVHKNPHTR